MRRPAPLITERATPNSSAITFVWLIAYSITTDTLGTLIDARLADQP